MIFAGIWTKQRCFLRFVNMICSQDDSAAAQYLHQILFWCTCFSLKRYCSSLWFRNCSRSYCLFDKILINCAALRVIRLFLLPSREYLWTCNVMMYFMKKNKRCPTFSQQNVLMAFDVFRCYAVIWSTCCFPALASLKTVHAKVQQLLQ